MRAVLHLGTYKTGTSSLQNMLHANRDLLRENGVLYPTSGLKIEPKLGIRHSPLIFGFMSGKQKIFPDALAKEITESGCETVIFSAEPWSAPMHQSQLTRFTCALEEAGFDDIQGIVLFRNLADYHVSHYREFTVNQKNAAPYRDYVRRPVGLFDYLFLLQTYRGLFGNGLRCLPYDQISDSCAAVFDSLGLRDLFDKLQPTPKANVKKLDALDIEAIRCSNALKLEHDAGLAALAQLRQENTDFNDSAWTEQSAGAVMPTSASYQKRFKTLSGWSADWIDTLFTNPHQNARNVSEVTDRLMGRLT
ncbi:MAG: hypothetical protein ABJH07_23235 [Sedimentitalea sp.]|uniref:hypothetical protein n=1 Tax=Sedimentitalea sp. TaxID=2048915 RepID=UPI003267EB88